MATKLYKLLRDILEKNGCYFIREAKGSHEFWGSPINNAKFPVATSIESIYLANKILKQAGIDHKI